MTGQIKNSGDWLTVVVAGLVKKLRFWYGVTGDSAMAIEKAKSQTTAGAKAWEMALHQMGWN